MYVYICVPIYMYIYIHTHKHMCDVYVYTCIHTYIHTYVMSTYTHTRNHAIRCIYIYIYICHMSRCKYATASSLLFHLNFSILFTENCLRYVHRSMYVCIGLCTYWCDASQVTYIHTYIDICMYLIWCITSHIHTYIHT